MTGLMKLKPRSFAYMKGISSDCMSPRTPREEEAAGDLALEVDDEGDEDEASGAAAFDTANALDGGDTTGPKEESWKLFDKRALSSVTAYTDDLMYLDDRFQEIALMLRIAFARQQKVCILFIFPAFLFYSSSRRCQNKREEATNQQRVPACTAPFLPLTTKPNFCIKHDVAGTTARGFST